MIIVNTLLFDLISLSQEKAFGAIAELETVQSFGRENQTGQPQILRYEDICPSDTLPFH